MSDPLETRSLPGAFWENVPQSIKEWDHSLQDRLASTFDLGSPLFIGIRWLTENVLGVAILTVLFAGLVFVRRKRFSSVSLRSLLKTFVFDAFTLGIFVGLSDLFSIAIKHLVGRLKPHVNWWDPNADLPALSLPSSHAMNSMFALLIVAMAMSSVQRHAYRLELVAFAFLCLILGLSRILLGQHYPLDVLSGWIFALLLALLLRPFFCRALARRPI